MNDTPRLIESDAFPFEFLSLLAERESWRKELHRPIYHVHKWWAKRLGSVFRGILLGGILDENADLESEFYVERAASGLVVYDPFCGSGTTLGEAHKLGLIALGRDINPVAVEAVRIGLGRQDKSKLFTEYRKLAASVGKRISLLYKASDSRGDPCEVLYYFWVMISRCPQCQGNVELRSNWVLSKNAYPQRHPEIQVLCPQCRQVFQSDARHSFTTCDRCNHSFDPHCGPVNGAKAQCNHCSSTFLVIEALSASGRRPEYKLDGKIVLRPTGVKEYLPISDEDLSSYREAARILSEEIQKGSVNLPTLELSDGHNTRQAISYGFIRWTDFFNDRQLLALSWLHNEIAEIEDEVTRDAFLLLFSGLLEFNNMFASFKGEGTGAVRHMFSHHILKPERTPIEANVWGTPRSSGSFSGMFQNRLIRALEYRESPTEILPTGSRRVVASRPFSDGVSTQWPSRGMMREGSIYLSCGDSAESCLPSNSVDLIVTDPPFFDNVHYSELADFFYAWQRAVPRGLVCNGRSTRHTGEVQDKDSNRFAEKLASVFGECSRVLKADGLLIFTYHHSRREGWQALSSAIEASGFTIINTHPIRSEMTVATPKAQSRNPIQLDIVIVCRKAGMQVVHSIRERIVPEAAEAQIARLRNAGFDLSEGDLSVIRNGANMRLKKSLEIPKSA